MTRLGVGGLLQKLNASLGPNSTCLSWGPECLWRGCVGVSSCHVTCQLQSCQMLIFCNNSVRGPVSVVLRGPRATSEARPKSQWSRVSTFLGAWEGQVNPRPLDTAGKMPHHYHLQEQRKMCVHCSVWGERV